MIDDLRESAFNNQCITKMAIPIVYFDIVKNDTSEFPKYPQLSMKRLVRDQHDNDAFEAVDQDERGDYDCPQLWCFFRNAHLSYHLAYEGCAKAEFLSSVQYMIRHPGRGKEQKAQIINVMTNRLEKYVRAMIDFPPSSEITDEKLIAIGLALVPKAALEDRNCIGEHIRDDWCTAVYYLAQVGHKDCKVVVRESLSAIEAKKNQKLEKDTNREVKKEQRRIKKEERRIISEKLQAERMEVEEQERLARQAELTERAATREAKEQAMKEEELMAEKEKARIAKERTKRKQQHKEEERLEKFGKKKKSA